DQEVPPALHEPPLQPSGRADAGSQGGLRPARGRGRAAGSADGAAQGRQRRPRRHAAPRPPTAAGAGEALLPLPGRLDPRDQPPAHHGRNRPGDRKALQGHTSGMGVPHFVIDAPGGGGKIPLLPSDYLVSLTPEQAILTNYEGKTYIY